MKHGLSCERYIFIGPFQEFLIVVFLFKLGHLAEIIEESFHRDLLHDAGPIHCYMKRGRKFAYFFYHKNGSFLYRTPIIDSDFHNSQKHNVQVSTLLSKNVLFHSLNK